MRFKYYLRGIGLGILFATIVMTVAYEVHKSEIEISDTKVIERAEELGMEFPDSTIDGSTVLDTSVTEAAEAVTETEVESQLAEEDGSVETPDETPAEGDEADPGEENADEPQTPEEPVVTDATITIEGGTTWRIIASSLAEQGIITDADDFWKYVYHNANGKTLHTGTYTIPAGSDYDTIISILTS